MYMHYFSSHGPACVDLSIIKVVSCFVQMHTMSDATHQPSALLIFLRGVVESSSLRNKPIFTILKWHKCLVKLEQCCIALQTMMHVKLSGFTTMCICAVWSRAVKM